MANYLIKQGNAWSVKVPIPKNVQPIFDQKPFTKSLKTSEKQVAIARSGPLILQFKASIDKARSDPHAHPDAVAGFEGALLEQLLASQGVQLSEQLTSSAEAETIKTYKIATGQAIAQAANEHIARQGILPNPVEDLKANEVVRLNKKLELIARMFSSRKPTRGWSNLIERIDIAPGQLTITLDAIAISKHLALPPERLSPDALVLSAPFQLRRRGIETKIILGNTPPEVDQTLIRNIVKAMGWYDLVKSGKSFAQIATNAGVTTNRVRYLIYLAFLAPDIIEQAIGGTLPLHMTSDYLIRTGIPSCWNVQRQMLANVNARTTR